MQDGYYLSTYLTPPGVARLIGAWVRHDSNISLWRKTGDQVDLLAHWELERFTGVKHDGTTTLTAGPLRALVDELIGEFGLSWRDLRAVWGTPGLDDRSDPVGGRVETGLARHAMGHLFTGIFLDSRRFYQDSIVALAIDGGPDAVLERTEPTQLFAGAAVTRGRMSVFPVESPGPLYDQAKYRFGMAEGSLMALASATSARCEYDVEQALAAGYYGDRGVHRTARRTVEEICAAGAAVVDEDPRFTDRENHISAVMKVVQELSYRVVERNVARIVAEHGIDPAGAWLSMTGGYALNCPTNSRLVEQFGFLGLSSPPYVNDGGQSVGIALEHFYVGLQPRPMRHALPGPYLGRSDRDLDTALAGVAQFVESVDGFDPDVAAADVIAGPVVWFNGAAESGPRALGNRSILADPRSVAAKDRLNEVKQREWWRPVAPVVLTEDLDAWFCAARESPYMLETFLVRPERTGQVPAIAHLDSSARLQCVDADRNPMLARVVRAFRARTAVPMLCNTSLNDKLEAIIDTIPEALNFCLRKRIEVAYVNGSRVRFRNWEAYPETEPAPREAPWLRVSDEAIDRARPELNPAGLEDIYLFVYVYNPELNAKFDVSDARSAARLRSVVDMLFRRNPALREQATATMEQERKRLGELPPFDGGIAGIALAVDPS